MRHYSSQELTPAQTYKLISGSLIPRPIAWITTLGPKPEQVLNLAPFSFFSAMPAAMPLVTVSIGRINGHQKDTARNLLDSEEAVIHLVDQSLAQEMNQTAVSLPPEQSELDLTKLTVIPSQTVAVPAIAEPKIRFETNLYQYVPVKGPDDRPVADLFILKVVDFFYADSVLDPKTFHVNALDFDPLARLAGPTYGKIHDLLDLIRPK